MATRVQVIQEVLRDPDPAGWTLALQWCMYVSEDGKSQKGYRFIWRRSDGSLQPARGQARIPSLDDAERLIQLAKESGWGDLKAGVSESNAEGRDETRSEVSGPHASLLDAAGTVESLAPDVARRKRKYLGDALAAKRDAR